MVNETRDFPMPVLTTMGSAQMFERAKANGLIAPMKGYKIYVCGALPSGLAPEAWVAVKEFWTMYFAAAGADLVVYSVECEIGRY